MAEPSAAPEELSAKDLKALKKAEKAAKRAAQKEAAGLPPRKDDPAKPKPPGQQAQGGPVQQPITHGTSSSGAPPAHKRGESRASSTQVASDKRLALFGHLQGLSGKGTIAPASKEVHYSIQALALKYSSYKIVGSTARCKAMLETFKHVIQDYETPAGTSLSRNLTSHLSHQIDYLKSARPLSVAMGNAIRWLKQVISKVSIDLSDTAARQLLLEMVDNFIRERIDVADRVIVESAVQNIGDGDVILTYAASHVVTQTLLEAHRINKRFKVIIVDSRPLFEGKKVARILAEAGISTTYVVISSLSYVIKDVTTVFLGAHAMLSNGLLFSRVGTAMVAMAAKSRNIPVLVLCESIKFSDRVQLDSVTSNELAPGDNLVDISIKSNSIATKSAGLENWKSIPQLNILNILYDLSPHGAIKKVITELGSLPASSVPVILREYKSE